LSAASRASSTSTAAACTPPTRPGAAHGARRLHPPPGRREHLGRALAPITASNPDDKGELFDPAADKIYRHPTFYEIPDEVGHM
jgi:hypothetical protein